MQDRITAGDTLNFPTTVTGYPASEGWVLSYRLVPRTAGAAILLTAVANGDDYLVQETAFATTAWVPGIYSWSSWVTLGTESYSLSSGVCTVLPDPRTITAPFDTRTDARKALDDAKAALKAWTPTQRKYRIGEREMEFNSVAEIIKVIAFWQSEVAAEERLSDTAKGYPDRRKVYVRMSNA